MLCEGVLLYFLLVKVFGGGAEDKVKYFYLFGWGKLLQRQKTKLGQQKSFVICFRHFCKVGFHSTLRSLSTLLFVNANEIAVETRSLCCCFFLGFPVIIVAISLGVTQADGYGSPESCWLDVPSGLIWAFIAPAILIILVSGNCFTSNIFVTQLLIYFLLLARRTDV